MNSQAPPKWRCLRSSGLAQQQQDLVIAQPILGISSLQRLRNGHIHMAPLLAQHLEAGLPGDIDQLIGSESVQRLVLLEDKALVTIDTEIGKAEIHLGSIQRTFMLVDDAP